MNCGTARLWRASSMAQDKKVHLYKVKTIAEVCLGLDVINFPVEFEIKDFNEGFTLQQLIDMEFKRHNMVYSKKKKHFFITQIY